jgi:hypothetical protein
MNQEDAFINPGLCFLGRPVVTVLWPSSINWAALICFERRNGLRDQA